MTSNLERVVVETPREEFRSFGKIEISRLKRLFEAQFELFLQGGTETELMMPEEGGGFADWVRSIGVKSKDEAFLAGRLEDGTAVSYYETDKLNVYLMKRQAQDQEWARKRLLILKERPTALE